MGLYDDIVVDDKQGQVKLWHDVHLRRFQVGDKVPRWGGIETYSIAMREGGYVNIRECTLESWTDEAEHELIADKYGDPFTKESVGLLGEDYLMEKH